jgi:Zn finger protein HypA/HybF involved in hydrogenase expression
MRILLNHRSMHIILEETNLDKKRIECPRCHWQGSAGEVKKGDHLLMSNITEFYCPACNSYLGFIQHGHEDEENTMNSEDN